MMIALVVISCRDTLLSICCDFNLVEWDGRIEIVGLRIGPLTSFGKGEIPENRWWPVWVALMSALTTEYANRLASGQNQLVPISTSSISCDQLAPDWLPKIDWNTCEHLFHRLVQSSQQYQWHRCTETAAIVHFFFHFIRALYCDLLLHNKSFHDEIKQNRPLSRANKTSTGPRWNHLVRWRVRSHCSFTHARTIIMLVDTSSFINDRDVGHYSMMNRVLLRSNFSGHPFITRVSCPIISSGFLGLLDLRVGYLWPLRLPVRNQARRGTDFTEFLFMMSMFDVLFGRM